MIKIFNNKYLNFCIKAFISLLLIWTIYQQVFAKEDIVGIKETFIAHFRFPNLFWLLAILFLVPFNWGFETLKWRELIKNFSDISFWKTYKAILAGVTISLFTPNRIGEYGGRILLLKPENNWKGVVATLVGSMAQLTAILIFGLLGAVYFSYQYLSIDGYILQLILWMGLALIGILVICFFNIDFILPIVKRLPFADYLRKYVKQLKVLRKYTARNLAITLLYAAIRLFIYTTQYYMMLKFFDIEVPFIAGLAGIVTIFLLQSSIPLPPIMGLLARGEFALFIWGYFSDSQIDILAATFSLFIINLTIPAMLGLVFIIRTNVTESLGLKANSKTDTP